MFGRQQGTTYAVKGRAQNVLGDLRLAGVAHLDERVHGAGERDQKT